MNTYHKFCPNVFLAKCDKRHEKGETINVTTKYGKENESIVFNIIFERLKYSLLFCAADDAHSCLRSALCFAHFCTLNPSARMME